MLKYLEEKINIVSEEMENFRRHMETKKNWKS